MPTPRRVHDAEGWLTEEAIVALARRVWWSESRDGFPIHRDDGVPGVPVKWTPLRLWFTRERWPPWWVWERWYECGDGLEARTAGGRLEPWLEVRRPWWGVAGRRRLPAVRERADTADKSGELT